MRINVVVIAMISLISLLSKSVLESCRRFVVRSRPARRVRKVEAHITARLLRQRIGFRRPPLESTRPHRAPPLDGVERAKALLRERAPETLEEREEDRRIDEGRNRA